MAKPRTHQEFEIPSHFRWVVLYWMPYDNDLHANRDPILRMLCKGSRTQEVIIRVFADAPDQQHLRRITILDGEVIEDLDLGFPDSSDATFFAKCMMDTAREITAQHWMLSILSHGGKLDEICPDHGSWMRINDIRRSLESMTRHIGRKLDLLFLQNCCKGTIEANVEFAEVASCILSSQEVLGAPNTYYPRTFRWLARTKDATGEDLARKIVETDTMFESYTVIRTVAIDQALVKLRNAITETVVRDARVRKSLHVTFYDGEQLVDLHTLLRAHVTEEGDNTPAVSDCVTFVQEHLVELFEMKGSIGERVRGLVSWGSRNDRKCGLSVLLPDRNDQLEKYAGLRFYREVPMFQLTGRFVKS